MDEAMRPKTRLRLTGASAKPPDSIATLKSASIESLKPPRCTPQLRKAYLDRIDKVRWWKC